jgi:hypothetical protein
MIRHVQQKGAINTGMHLDRSHFVRQMSPYPRMAGIKKGGPELALRRPRRPRTTSQVYTYHRVGALSCGSDVGRGASWVAQGDPREAMSEKTNANDSLHKRIEDWKKTYTKAECPGCGRTEDYSYGTLSPLQATEAPGTPDETVFELQMCYIRCSRCAHVRAPKFIHSASGSE